MYGFENVFCENFNLTIFILGVWNTNWLNALKNFVLGLPRTAKFNFCIFKNENTVQFYPEKEPIARMDLTQSFEVIMAELESNCDFAGEVEEAAFIKNFLDQICSQSKAHMKFRDLIVFGDVSKMNINRLKLIQTNFYENNKGRISFVQTDNYVHELVVSSESNQSFKQSLENSCRPGIIFLELMEFLNKQMYYIVDVKISEGNIVFVPINYHFEAKHYFNFLLIVTDEPNKKQKQKNVEMKFIIANIYDDKAFEFETRVDFSTKSNIENIQKFIAQQNILGLEYKFNLIKEFAHETPTSLKLDKNSGNGFLALFTPFEQPELHIESIAKTLMALQMRGFQTTGSTPIIRDSSLNTKNLDLSSLMGCSSIWPNNYGNVTKLNEKEIVQCDVTALGKFIETNYCINPAILIKMKKQFVEEKGSDAMKAFVFDLSKHQDAESLNYWRKVLSIAAIFWTQEYVPWNYIFGKILRFLLNIDPKFPAPEFSRKMGNIKREEILATGNKNDLNAALDVLHAFIYNE
jgi:hypothetical protein